MDNLRRRLMASDNDNGFPIGSVANFDYTGSALQITLPKGKYKLQCWGAQGGSTGSHTYEFLGLYYYTTHELSEVNIYNGSGGTGGYSEGILTLNEPTNLYVFVGGQGNASGDDTSCNGGWNGGGGCSTGYSASRSYYERDTSIDYNSFMRGYYYDIYYNATGGGSTDIALASSSSTLDNYTYKRTQASYLSRIIVAGGGGGGKSHATRADLELKLYNTDLVSSGGGIDETDSTWETSSGTNYGALIDLYSLGLSSNNTAILEMTHNSSSMIHYAFLENDPDQDGVNFVGSNEVIIASDHVSTTIPYGAKYLYVSMLQGGYNRTPTQITIKKNEDDLNEASYYNDYSGGGTQGNGDYSGIPTQNSCYIDAGFGYAGYSGYASNSGGGAGWYGGSGSYTAGGSGFVNISSSASNRPTGYTGILLDSGSTVGSNQILSPTGEQEYGHFGNGYARITRLEAYNTKLIFKNSSNQPVSNFSVTVTSATDNFSSTTDSNGTVSFILSPGTYTISYDSDHYSLSTTLFTVSGTSTTNIVVSDRTQWDYEYKGSVYNIEFNPGTYLIECWGAKGGDISDTKHGGFGGYSTGKLTLSSSTTLYVSVGGSGTGSGSGTGAKSGGWNGGGKGYSPSSTYYNCGGGGASDVRIGLNQTLARVIVAGGGGGAGSSGSSAANRNIGGVGGGTTGGSVSTISSYKGGEGGTQTAAGDSYYSQTKNSTTYGTLASFGNGGGYKGSYACSGGGGGWYGGGYSFRNAGGGGSGYVYTSETASNYPSGCLLNSNYYLTDAATYDGETEFTSIDGNTETGHNDAGYVRITKI